MFSILGDVDEHLVSLPEFKEDSLIIELLNGPMDSQRDSETCKWLFRLLYLLTCCF